MSKKIEIRNQDGKTIIELPNSLDNLKKKCKEIYNLTPKQEKSMVLKYRESPQDDDDIFLEDEGDYGNLATLDDLTLAHISIKYDCQENLIKENSPVNISQDIARDVKHDEIRETISISKYEGGGINDLNKQFQELEHRLLNSLTDKLMKSHIDLKQSFTSALKNQQDISSVNTSINQSKQLSSKNKIRQYGIECNECHEVDFQGNRYKCSTCEKYELCKTCFKKINHEHLFLIIKDTSKMSLLVEEYEKRSIVNLQKSVELKNHSLSQVNENKKIIKEIENEIDCYEQNKYPNCSPEEDNSAKGNDFNIINSPGTYKQKEVNPMIDKQIKDVSESNNRSSGKDIKRKQQNISPRNKIPIEDDYNDNKNAVNDHCILDINIGYKDEVISIKKEENLTNKDSVTKLPEVDYDKMLQDFDDKYGTYDLLTKQRRKDILIASDGNFETAFDLMQTSE